MRLFKIQGGVYIEHEDRIFKKRIENWDEFINRKDLFSCVLKEIKGLDATGLNLKDCIENKELTAPIGSQEVWAAGVTYMRSKEARMEESEKAGGADFYDKVYKAKRPELFFKAMANRVVGTNEHLFIRRDSTWNVPEPELTLFISAEGTIEGYTIGNDMSSRSIEGENPLYLPQAKVYERCAGLGPCVYVCNGPIDPNTRIDIQISRNGNSLFEEDIKIDQIKRKFTELVHYLYKECDFPSGCFLMTGTGMVPPDNFTLQVGDVVKISIDSIGTLVNTISQKP